MVVFIVGSTMRHYGQHLFLLALDEAELRFHGAILFMVDVTTSAVITNMIIAYFTHAFCGVDPGVGLLWTLPQTQHAQRDPQAAHRALSSQSILSDSTRS